METTPRKGMSKGCLVGLIVTTALVVIVIAGVILIYVFRGSFVKFGAATSVREVKILIAKAPPDGLDTVQFNALADAFVDELKQDENAQFQPLAVLVQQMLDVVKDKKVTREEAKTTGAAMIGMYPDLVKYWAPKPEEVSTPTPDSLGGE